jgi:predicted nuclease of predicted toxin-antitoxin system
MQRLADENLDRAIIEWLRDEGQDVQWVAEFAGQAADEQVVQMARDGRRMLLTSDLDFGELVYRKQAVMDGVLLLRLRGASQLDRLTTFQKHWPVVCARLPGHFVVMGERKIRIRPLRGGQDQ